MAQAIDERLLEEIEDQHKNGYPIASLIELGREKGYVTLDDISTILPDSERSISQLRELLILKTIKQLMKLMMKLKKKRKKKNLRLFSNQKII